MTVAVTACVEDAATTTQATLAPLPLPLPSSTTMTTTLAPDPAATTTVAVVVQAPTTTLAPQPVGDWDGARFDFGRVVDDDEDGIYRTIEFDRYSYQHPMIGLVDAAGFIEEPLPVWWTTEPYVNNNPSTRRFVLAPNAEILQLSEEGEDVACADPPPAAPPAPVWQGVDVSFLDTRAARNSIAIVTYAPSGAITRLRFTRGCP